MKYAVINANDITKPAKVCSAKEGDEHVFETKLEALNYALLSNKTKERVLGRALMDLKQEISMLEKETKDEKPD